MRKVMALVLGLLVLAAVPAMAGEVKGTVKAIDRADSSIVLDDGTKLTVSERQLGNLAPGEEVRAMYQMEGGKNVATEIDPRGIGSDSRGTTRWGWTSGAEPESFQAE